MSTSTVTAADAGSFSPTTLIESVGGQNARVRPGKPLSVVVIEKFDVLEQYIPAWEQLAASALEPNPFYESWMLIPALRSFGAGKNLRLILIFAPNEARPSGPPVLCGLFPLELKRQYKSMPVKALSLWKHLYCFLSTPLIRADVAHECLTAFFDWLTSNPDHASLIEFLRVSGEGPFNRLLIEYLNEKHVDAFYSERYARALLRRSGDGDEYIRSAVSREHRKDLRRRAKRLSEDGSVSFDSLDANAGVDEWLEEFLSLEASGWKGVSGGAFAANEMNQKYFLTIGREAFLRGRLMMLAMRLNGKPIAAKCNFLAERGAFAFKIAYDEQYSYHSPGVLLEIENIRQVHQRPDIDWMDSCANPDHPMINRLWLDRRVIQTLVVPTGIGAGSFLVSLMPATRWINRSLRSLSSRLVPPSKRNGGRK
jgi:CelD/BcsL family acetyltransferase involved in cellulose biosynthesis